MSYLQEAYQRIYAEEREKAWWAARDVLPGAASKPPVDYPLPLRESQLSALHQEARRLGRLAFEGASWFVLSPDGDYLKMGSPTLFHEALSRVPMDEVICDIYEANGGSPGGGAIIMHSHPMVERGGRIFPSKGDLAAIHRIRESLRKAGLHLQDFVICGQADTQAFSWRESVADGEFADLCNAILEG